MTKKYVLLILSLLLLSSCVSEVPLKRSANNKLFDRGGFHSEKRRPLYNNKYIEKAKNNVARSEADIEEYDEEEQYLGNLHPSLRNRYMYEDMVEEDMKSAKVRRAKKRAEYLRKMRNDDKYYHLGEARDRVRESEGGDESKELRRELKEIKTMLDSARKDLVKYRCPVDEDGEIVIKKHEAAPKKIHEEMKKEEKKEAKKPATPAKKKTVHQKPKVEAQAPPKLKINNEKEAKKQIITSPVQTKKEQVETKNPAHLQNKTEPAQPKPIVNDQVTEAPEIPKESIEQNAPLPDMFDQSEEIMFEPDEGEGVYNPQSVPSLSQFPVSD